MKRILLVILTLFYRLLLSAIVLGALAYVLLATPLGFDIILKSIVSMVPGTLTIEQAEGKLISGMTLRNVAYHNSALDFKCENLTMVWDLSRLRQKHITINALDASHVQLDLHKTETKSKPVDYVRLANHISSWLRVNQIQLDDVNITQADFAAIQGSFALNQKDADNYVLKMTSNVGNVDGTLYLNTAQDIIWKTTLNANNLDFGSVLKDYRGALSFRLTSNGAVNATQQRINASLQNIAGNVNAYPIKGVIAVNYTDGQLQIQPSNLLVMNSQVFLQGSLGKDWNISWRANLQNLNTYVPILSGSVSAQGDIKGDKAAPVLHASIAAKRLQLKEYAIDANALNLNLTGIYKDKSLTVFIPNGKVTSINLEDVKQINSSLHGSATLAGSFSEPDIMANVEFLNATAYVPEAGIRLNAKNIKLAYTFGQPLKLNADISSGAGVGVVAAEFAFEKQIRGKIQLKGQNLQAINLHHYKLIVNPDLALNFTDNNYEFTGNVTVPEARITPNNFENVTTLPDEVTFVDEKSPTQDTQKMPARVALHVGLNLSKNIFISYQNLQTNLSGSVQVDGEPGKDLRATGSVYTVNGQYKAYGKQLNITQGRIIYTGNLLTNPGLDIQATQKIKALGFTGSSQFTDAKEFAPVYMGANSITIGVLVRGTLQKPIISLYSDSNLNQDDILSYLVFGYPRSQITKTSSLALLNSFATNLKTGKTSLGSVKSSVQNMLGLSEMDIGTAQYFDPATNTATNTTAVSLGKQIGKHLYLHYSIGIFNPIQILNLKYQINKHLSIQSETSSKDNGADIFYELERA